MLGTKRPAPVSVYLKAHYVLLPVTRMLVLHHIERKFSILHYYYYYGGKTKHKLSIQVI